MASCYTRLKSNGPRFRLYLDRPTGNHRSGRRIGLSGGRAESMTSGVGSLDDSIDRMSRVERDVTEERQLEVHGEGPYRQMFREMLGGLAVHEIICDDRGTPIDYRFLDVNPAFEAQTGLRAGDIVGRRAREVLPNLEPEWIERYGRVALTGIPDQFESYNADLGRYYEVRAYCPAPRQFAVVFHDVTALRERTAFAESVIGGAGGGLVVYDLGLHFAVWNQAMEAITGLKSADVLGRLPREVFPGAVGDDVERNIRNVLESGLAQSREFEFVVPVTGRKGWVHGTYRPQLDASGKTIGVIASVVDITARHDAEAALRDSEQRFRTLFDSVNDALFIRDPDGQFLEANRAACERLGYTREELLTMAVRDIDTPESVSGLAGRTTAIMSHGTTLFETEHHRKDGTTFPVEISSTLINLRGRDLVLSVARDISERKRAESERAALEENLRQAQKLEGIGLLAGGIAHDFNNLLTAIRGSASLAKAELQDNHKACDDLEQIELAVDRAARLTRQLLTFARRGDVRPVVIDLNSVLRGLEPMLRRVVREDVAMAVELADGQMLVRADPGQIEQVIVNLVVNAGDAMPDGGRLTLKLEEALASPGREDGGTGASRPMVCLSVADTGVGMDSQTLAHLFEPFFTTKAVGRGTGLGLATVYGIVSQAQGTVTVTSEPDLGSTFSVYLPRTVATDSRSPEPRTRPDVGAAPRTATILLVEDDDGVRRFTSRVLETAGYKVVAASNGETALAAANGLVVELLLTDVVMPGMGGREVATRLLAVQPQVRPVFMSGHTREGLQDGAARGEMKLLAKPFTAQELLAMVDDTLAEDHI
jgi:two-component system, cell cycle sensor histidine kinase and response regulator CckA